MKKLLILPILIAIPVGVGYLSLVSSSPDGIKERSGATLETLTEISGYKYTQTHNESSLGFSFKYPEGFDVTGVPDDKNVTLLVQNLAKKVGLQIIISPFDGDDIDITEDIVKESVSAMNISQPEEVSVGAARKGLMFTSDNEAFGGKSRDLWFVFKGNLYQFSTYYEFGPFLEGIFATWKFK